ncbi:MAG: MFS transporter [Alphaproteobacteria bacterium]
MRHIHQAIWLGAVGRPGSAAFIGLFTLDTLARATLITVLPLQAFHLLGDAQRVSALYFAASAAGLCGSLAIPWLVRRIQRRWTLTLGALCFIVAAPLLAQYRLEFLISGLVAYLFGGACVSVCLNLYVLDRIPRQTYTRFEPTRMLVSGGAWVVGPVLGVYLESHVAAWLPYAASAGFALAELGFFWFLRLGENPVIVPATAAPPNPARFVRRFFSQPRLALAWFLAMGRSAWWGMFYIYTPIYAVTAGLGHEAGGWLSSLGSAALFTVTLWGWVGRRYGLRRLLVGGYMATGLLTVAVSLMAGTPWLGAAFLLAAAFGAAVTDGAGNVPFLRSVHPGERPEMTTVYASYRDVSRLSMPGLFSLILQYFTLPTVFATSGVIMLGLAWFARYIPRRLGCERERVLPVTATGR